MIAYCYKIPPTKARIQDAIDFFDKKLIKKYDKDVFWLNSVSHIMGYKILKSQNLFTFKNNSV